MKFICLGYIDESMWDGLSSDQRDEIMQQCFQYDDHLRRGGHFVGGEALQSADNAVTLRYIGNKVAITDGPFAETKEQLGGILVLEARDLNHAIALMADHPGVRCGPFEIRPANETIDHLARAHAATQAD